MNLRINYKVALLLKVMVLSVAVVVLSAACAKPAGQATTKQDFIFSTSVVLTIYDAGSEAVFTKIFARLREINDLMSAQKASSEINKVSDAAGIRPVQVSADTFLVMQRALAISRLSHGIFDPTIEPIVTLWNVAGDTPHVATAAEIKQTLPLVNWQDVQLDAAKRTIFLTRKGMRLDFGGIAKGYAADLAAEIAQQAGIKSALFSMGDSSIYLIGSKPDGSKWRVGVTNPEPESDFSVERGALLGVIECSDSAIDTSGPYQRYFVQGGKRYHHIMDPRTGRPAVSGLEQVTIVTPSQNDLPDGVSTVCYILGLDAGMQFIKQYPQAAAIFVTSDKKVYVTKNLGDRFRLTDSSFTLEQR